MVGDHAVHGALMTAVVIVALLCSAACAPPARGQVASVQASPDSAAEAVLEGTLEVLVEDSSQGSRTVYFLSTSDMRVELRFSKSPNLITGAHIRVHGRWAGDKEIQVASFEILAQ
jgi:hypothetical protein